jgi:hypothetical protein
MLDFDRMSDVSTRDLIRSLFDDLTELVRKEVALARAEVTIEIRKAVRAGVVAGAAGGLLAAGLLLLITAAGLAISSAAGWPTWAGVLILGGAAVMLGLILCVPAWTMVRRIRVVPEQTLESMKENMQWMSARTSFGSRRETRVS